MGEAGRNTHTTRTKLAATLPTVTGTVEMWTSVTALTLTDLVGPLNCVAVEVVSCLYPN